MFTQPVLEGNGSVRSRLSGAVLADEAKQPGKVVDVKIAHAAQVERVLFQSVEQVLIEHPTPGHGAVIIENEGKPIWDAVPVKHLSGPS
ncbi:hypothetical protein Mro03_01470 [Microbispora rosea subsp. rosea]|nr:hypothetical protein Mro03_01470 [Microbispora rosea subsp. rosea]